MLRAALATALTAAALLAGSARAQQASEPGADEDPNLIVARTVQPRIAYRGIPTEDNPVMVRATTFPAQIFHGTLNGTLDQLLGDGDLGQRGSAGMAVHAATQALTGPALGNNVLLGPGGSAGAPPMGPGASVGGAIGAATAGLGDLITHSVMQAVAPAANGGGK
ncbi:hypothetical protein DX914_16480 [Lysobacter silvisoli]|uniref:Adhesin n=1 Tax=Lysobacter silvisoli TaxID=2293254 RepID=A0A371JY41_9GAMM|nr:hypothetical protein DX914_16480 [Lysobacter silvisoli]